MLPSFLFLLLGALFGFVIIRLVRSPYAIEEQVAWAVPIGIMLLATSVFFLSLILPNQNWAIVCVTFASGATVFYYFNLDRERRQISQEWRKLRDRFGKKEILAWLLVWGPWLIYTAITVPYLLFWRDGNLIAGWINTWGDWAVHLRASTFFTAHTKLSLESPVYSGTLFHYPYLSAYLSSILQRLNLDIASSLTWPTFALFGILPMNLYLTGKRITGSRKAGVIFTYLVLLSGGMGVWLLIKDLVQGHYFWLASAYQPLLYTDALRQNGTSTNDSLWFMNSIMSEFFPQRAFLAGIGTALYILTTAWLNPPDRRHLMFTGLLFGLLPLIHTHSFIALGIILPILYLIRGFAAFKKGLWLLGPAAILGSILLWTLVFDRTATGSFIRAIPLWVPQPENPVNPLWYWWRNSGPFLALGLLTLSLKKQPLRSLLIAGLVVFVICNRLSFQPWQYDNLKLLTYWYLLWSLPIAVLISQIPRAWWWTSAALIILLTGAGLADTLSITTSARSGGLELNSRADLAFAAAVQKATPENGLILAGTGHDNPLSISSGRQLYMGYEGWLWTYGINWSQRYQELTEMFSASPNGLALIRAKKIDYIAIGPQERRNFHANVAVLKRHFQTIVELPGYELLRVR